MLRVLKGKDTRTRTRTFFTKHDSHRKTSQTATERMKRRNGGVAKHNSTCGQSIDWDIAKIVGEETRYEDNTEKT